MKKLSVKELQAKIGQISEIGGGQEPLAITSRGKVVLFCLPVADEFSAWRAIADALQDVADGHEADVVGSVTWLQRWLVLRSGYK